MSSLTESLSIAIKVLADWRVIAIAIAVLLVWAALRYVGSIYHRRPKVASRPTAPIKKAAPAASAGRRAARSRATPVEEEAE